MPAVPKPAFDWNDANTGHIAKHKVAPDEAEQVVSGASLLIETADRSGEDRYTELGETAAGRLLLVVWTWRGGRIRVVTAFPANRRWRVLWRRIKGGHDA
ncbi:MAG: BrnT family toxin [Acidobacteria bacterium]|nr:BrnT family toxin [Acidobacteriota bacterium]